MSTTHDTRSVATQQASEVAATAQDKAGEVAHEAVDHGREVLDRAKDGLREQAHARTREIGDGLHRLSDEARALAEGRNEDAGPLVDYAQRAAQQLEEIAQRVDREGFDGILNDVADFGRRRPGTFLALAGVAGFITGRMVRASRGGIG